MDERQQQRALSVIKRVSGDLERGVQHFDGAGQRLTDVSSIIEAWVKGRGLVVKEPENAQVVTKWIRQ